MQGIEDWHWKNDGYIVPARTAQGGGGSVKDRKPHQERFVSLWVMDGRANPLMDQKVVGASAYLSVYLSACLTN